jgi:hypothetical protein
MPKADPGRLDRLTTTRDRLAEALADGPSTRDMPALSREYRLLLAEIDSLSTVEDADAVDQLAARRGAKGSRRTRRTS